MDFHTGILNLTNWAGNVILPTLAGLFLSVAVVCFSKGRDYHHWMYGGFLSLMASGLLRMTETFTSQLAWNNPDLYWNSLLNLTNWVANVVLPLYLGCKCCSSPLRGPASSAWSPAFWRHFGAGAHRPQLLAQLRLGRLLFHDFGSITSG